MSVLPPDPVYTFRSATDASAINCICFHRSERLVSGTAAGRVHLFDLQSNRAIHEFVVPAAIAEAATTTPTSPAITSVQKHDETLHTQQRGGSVAAWQLSNAGYQLAYRLDTQHTGFCGIRVLPERGWLLAPLGDTAIGVYDLRNSAALIGALRAPKSAAAAADVADVGATSAAGGCGHLMCFQYLGIEGRDYVLGCYESGDFVTWEAGAGGGRIVDCQRLAECPMTVDYDGQTNRGICGGPAAALGVFGYNRSTMQLQRRPDIALKTAGVNCVRIRGDRRVFSVAGWDGRIRVYSWSSLRPLAVLTEHRVAVAEVAYSADRVALWNRPVMAAADKEGRISLWDLYN